MTTLNMTMQGVPILKEPVPRKMGGYAEGPPKFPMQTTAYYSHLLYLSEDQREVYSAKVQRLSSSSLHSTSSTRSTCSTIAPSIVSSCDTTRFNNPAPRYADDHYPLITTIHPEVVPPSVPKNHAALWCARQMAQIHNTIIRGLNASWNHAVAVQPATAAAADFLLFNQQLFNTLDHHRKVNDDYLFREIDKLLRRSCDKTRTTLGRESFAEGLALFEKYVFITKPSEFNGLTFRHIIESFAGDLVQHLHEDIPAVVGFHQLDSDTLMKVWKHATRIASKNADLSISAPWTLGCQDRAFTIDGAKTDSPEVPWILGAVVRNWHARKHAGVWKFCPSDLSGRRRQLTAA